MPAVNQDPGWYRGIRAVLADSHPDGYAQLTTWRANQFLGAFDDLRGIVHELIRLELLTDDLGMLADYQRRHGFAFEIPTKLADCA